MIEVQAEPVKSVDWTAFRTEMPVARQWAYFDHAAVAPSAARPRRQSPAGMTMPRPMATHSTRH